MATKKATSKSSNPTVSVSLRIDPKSKYLIDLLAREQKRTITGVIEWALDRAAMDTSFYSDMNDSRSYAEVIDSLWSTDESVRLIKLAITKPGLLDYDEMRVWETIRASKDFWKVHVSDSVSGGPSEDYMHKDLIQKHWDELIEHVAKHRNSRSIVPFEVPENEKRQKGFQPEDFSDFDDEIPF